MIAPDSKIIIIGTLPPPVGGVSIYNQRLFDFFQNDVRLQVSFIDYKRHSLSEVIKAVLRHKIIYLSCSNARFKVLLATVARMAGKKFIVAFHGNLQRHTRGVDLPDKMALRLASTSIVLNKQSYDHALHYSRHVLRATAFIPPSVKEELSLEIQDLLRRCRQKYKVICASNAHNVSFDKDGREIYQVRFLLDLFSRLDDCCIILSDPSGMYSNYLTRHNVPVPHNVLVIKITHSFFELLKETDVMLRITTTDGDSISVREALYLNKIVIASNAVDRPEGVITVNIDKDEITQALRQVVAGNIHPAPSKTENGGEQVLQLFNSLN